MQPLPRSESRTPRHNTLRLSRSARPYDAAEAREAVPYIIRRCFSDDVVRDALAEDERLRDLMADFFAELDERGDGFDCEETLDAAIEEHYAEHPISRALWNDVERFLRVARNESPVKSLRRLTRLLLDRSQTMVLISST